MQLAAGRRLPDSWTKQQAGGSALVFLELDQVCSRWNPAGILKKAARVRGDKDVVLQEQGVRSRTVEKPLPRPCVTYGTGPVATGDPAQGQWHSLNEFLPFT